MQVDEAKVKALESIFGGQDITASVIRTVLTSNENKFDDAVDSLLNMTTNTQDTPPAPKKEEDDEDALFDRREREKIKTLEGMFGKDLSNSVICTVLESNKGELVDAVDTLLNMTSVELDPGFGGKKLSREDERIRQEQELKDYEEFKRMQIRLQEEEARAMKEQQLKAEEEAKRKAEDEKRSKEVLLEQEKLLRECEARKKQKEEWEAAQNKVRDDKRRKEEEDKRRKEEEDKRRKEEEDKRKKDEEDKKKKEEEEKRKRDEEDKKKKEEERKKKVLLEQRKREELAVLQLQKQREAEELKQKVLWEQKLATLKEAEEKLRREEEFRKAEVARRAQELQEKEQLLSKRAIEADLRLAKLREEEAQRYEARRRQLEDEMRIKEQQALKAEEAALKKKLEEEERAYRRKLEEEEKELALARRIEQEKAALALERAALEKRQQELLKKQEEQRLAAEALAAELKAKEEASILADSERKAELELISQRVKEAEERERLRREEEEARRLEEEHRLSEIARLEREEAIAREEREKQVYEQLAASAVFIPPKVQPAGILVSAVVVGDVVTCTWDIPEGNAAPTNWLGLYPVRQNNPKKYVQFVYTNGISSGEHVFRGVTPGQYNVHFYATRAYENAVMSDPVSVGPSATIMPQVQGEHVLVYYTLSPLSATPTREWIGIYEKTQRRNKLYLSTAYGNAEGQVMMKAPRNPGVYEVRLFATGAVYNESAKSEFVIEDNDCVNVEPASVMAGANVSINWILRTLEPSTGDWVGLYRADEANNSSYLSCTYTNGASVGTATIPAPKEVGVYEFRLFSKAKGKYTTHRTSLPLTVV